MPHGKRKATLLSYTIKTSYIEFKERELCIYKKTISAVPWKRIHIKWCHFRPPVSARWTVPLNSPFMFAQRIHFSCCFYWIYQKLYLVTYVTRIWVLSIHYILRMDLKSALNDFLQFFWFWVVFTYQKGFPAFVNAGMNYWIISSSLLHLITSKLPPYLCSCVLFPNRRGSPERCCLNIG